MKEKPPKKQSTAKEKSLIKGMSLADFGINGIASRIDVKDGKIVRIRPLRYDWKYQKESFNQWKMEAHGTVFEPTMKTLISPFGLAYKKRVYSPNRILYPLKRVDWDPDGERNTANRGASKYQRISWDEATDIIIKELKRIKKQYGMEAVLSQSDGHGEGKVIHTAHGSANKLLALLGGYTMQMRNTDSWEGWAWGAKHAWGMEPVGEMVPSGNLISDIGKNTELLLFWGCDPETTPWGFNGQMASRVCYWYSQMGIKCIYICPELNYGAAVHADKWIPIRPNTDAALQLAIAYIWMTEGTYDKEYVKTHTYGYDKFEKYVLGEEDSVAKTPEWASEKCSIPVPIIKALAHEWASKRTSIAHGNGGAGIRSAYATEQGRLEVLLLAMQGLGKPGVHQVKMLEWSTFDPKDSPMPPAIVAPRNFVHSYSVAKIGTKWAGALDGQSRKLTPMEKLLTPVPINPKQIIPKNLIHEAILNPPISWYGNTTFPGNLENQFIKYHYPVEGCSEIHMIWTDTPCWITCWNDSNTYIKALRNPKIEFVLAQHPWLENDCLLADIILPVSTKLEEKDFAMDLESGQYHTAFIEEQCIEPIGESKSDYEIVCMIAEKMGLLDKYTGGMSIDDMIKAGYDHSNIDGLTNFEDFKKNKYFVIPIDPKWESNAVGLENFYKNPEKSPLNTPSGKVEFCSQNLTKHFPDDEERPPVPHWIEKGEGHDDRISSPRAKQYPLILMSNHGRWRVHAQCDDITWTREIHTCKVTGPDGYKYEPLWINTDDAAARGIKNGDIVKIFNERGTVLGGAHVTERMSRGVVYMDHGARYDPIVPGELDRGGAINTITPHNITSKNSTGMVVSSFLVEVQQANMDELRKKYPGAFKRKYHADAGLRFDAWVE